MKEGSFRNGKVHGLQRIVYSDRVRVQLFNDGVRVATINFDRGFNETFRRGDDLNDLTGQHFNPDNQEPAPFSAVEEADID